METFGTSTHDCAISHVSMLIVLAIPCLSSSVYSPSTCDQAMPWFAKKTRHPTYEISDSRMSPFLIIPRFRSSLFITLGFEGVLWNNTRLGLRFIVLGRVAPGDCSPEALSRTGQGDFHHPAPPLMCLVADRCNAGDISTPAPHKPALSRGETRGSQVPGPRTAAVQVYAHALERANPHGCRTHRLRGRRAPPAAHARSHARCRGRDRATPVHKVEGTAGAD